MLKLKLYYDVYLKTMHKKEIINNHMKNFIETENKGKNNTCNKIAGCLTD